MEETEKPTEGEAKEAKRGLSLQMATPDSEGGEGAGEAPGNLCSSRCHQAQATAATEGFKTRPHQSDT